MTRDNQVWNILGLVGIVLGVLVATITDPAAYGVSPVVMRWLGLASVLLAALLKFANSQLPGANDAATVDVRKIAPVVLLCLTLPLLGGCAQSTEAKLQQADRSLVGVLASLDSTEQAMFKAGSVTPAFHKQFSGYLVTALTAGKTFHESVLAYQPGQQPLPVDIVMLTSAVRSAADLVRTLPASDQRDRIAAIIDTVALVANQILLVVLPPPQADALMPPHLVYAGGH